MLRTYSGIFGGRRNATEERTRIHRFQRIHSRRSNSRSVPNTLNWQAFFRRRHIALCGFQTSKKQMCTSWRTLWNSNSISIRARRIFRPINWISWSYVNVCWRIGTRWLCIRWGWKTVEMSFFIKPASLIFVFRKFSIWTGRARSTIRKDIEHFASNLRSRWRWTLLAMRTAKRSACCFRTTTKNYFRIG